VVELITDEEDELCCELDVCEREEEVELVEDVVPPTGTSAVNEVALKVPPDQK